MNVIMLMGSVIGFAPALFLIWFCLHKYAYPYVQGSLFEDRRVFFMLAVGMVAGSLIFVLELMLYPMFTTDENFYFVMFILIYVLAFPLLEDLAKFIILNFKGYRGRFDSTFYGVALGAGYSATAIIGYIVIDLGTTSGSIDLLTWLGLLFLSIATCLIHVSVGATIGSATGQNLGMRGIPLAVIPHMLFNMLMFPWFIYDQIWYSIVLALPLALIIFWGVYTKTIPECLPQEVQKEMRRDSRRRVSD
ncbi:MAG: hypothetical protein KAJ33_05185 [Thermoplasmata archaeon]|nr:hypothetical protein [Thermoplasmata archaeon]